MLSRVARLIVALMLPVCFACGDIGRVVVDLDFETEDLELRTRALEVVVRETDANADGCQNLWTQIPTGLAEDRTVMSYPNRVDVRASPVDLNQYPALTILVYAYPSEDISTSQPIAGGCTESDVLPDETTTLAVSIAPAP